MLGKPNLLSEERGGHVISFEYRPDPEKAEADRPECPRGRPSSRGKGRGEQLAGLAVQGNRRKIPTGPLLDKRVWLRYGSRNTFDYFIPTKDVRRLSKVASSISISRTK